MRCLYPVRRKIKESCGKWHYEYVPCGHCEACLDNYMSDWAYRGQLELSCHKKACYITLTYADWFLSLQNLEYQDGTKNSLQREVVDLFIKRLRKAVEPEKIRIFGSGEYGDEAYTRRPHYHLVVFGIDNEHPIFDMKRCAYKGGKLDHYYIIDWNLWRYGEVEIDKDCPTAKSIKYMTKYVAKRKALLDKERYYSERNIHPEFLIVPRRPGLGEKGIQKHKSEIVNNIKGRLSRYVVNKIDETSDYDFKGYYQYVCSQHPSKPVIVEQVERLMKCKQRKR